MGLAHLEPFVVDDVVVEDVSEEIQAVVVAVAVEDKVEKFVSQRLEHEHLWDQVLVEIDAFEDHQDV